jgi:SRSO17 transposase
MALTQVRTAIKAGFHIAGVVADADYGSTAAFRAQLERLGLRYGDPRGPHALDSRSPGGPFGRGPG